MIVRKFRQIASIMRSRRPSLIKRIERRKMDDGGGMDTVTSVSVGRNDGRRVSRIRDYNLQSVIRRPLASGGSTMQSQSSLSRVHGFNSLTEAARPRRHSDRFRSRRCGLAGWGHLPRGRFTLGHLPGYRYVNVRILPTLSI